MFFLRYKASLFVKNLLQTAVVFVLFSISFVIYVYAEKRIDLANESRLKSYKLADELRQSSDDLTRMVRTYIVTGDVIYKKHYQEILDIRNGIKPRPFDYQNIYWDLVSLNDKRPRPLSNKTIPLIDMIREAGFTSKEFQKLQEAKNNSDTLTKTEFEAIKLIEAQGSNEQKVKNKEKAIKILHDETYHNAKASIMRPLEEFAQLMEQRTDAAVNQTVMIALILRILFIMMGAFFFIMLWRLYQTIHKILGSSVENLHTQIIRIGKGDFSVPIQVDAKMNNSVLAWLGGMQVTLMDLMAHNERLRNLYAALSQCNQAIVRSKNEEELFPILCRDAIEFGGMKMAWIGMADESNNHLNVVSFYGDGSDYLKGILISIDPSDITSHGPTGRAFLNDTPFWCQDFQHNPKTALWHERGKRYGWGSSAALPLHRNGKVVGVFTLYSQDVNAFDEPAQKLLEEMTMDISYALDSFERERMREKAESALKISQEYLQSIIANEPECVKLVGLNGRLIDINPAGLAMLEVETLQEAQNYSLTSFVLPQWRAAFNEVLQSVMRGETAILEFEMQGIMGTHRWVESNAVPMHDSDGNITMILGITRDVTERKENEKRIHYLANFDALTGLANRTQFDIHIKDLLSTARRHKQEFSIMFLDLDHFKDINDTLGHRIGDELLIHASHRLKTILREEDILARFGGDEFIILLPNIDMNGVSQVAQKLLDTFKKSFDIDGNELSISVSIGIALYPNDGVDFDTLYKNADTAMYRAKKEGRNGFYFFTDEMQKNSIRHLELSNALRHALERNQFQLHYQPQFSTEKRTIIGAEVLLRWNHPELGNISPAEFIPMAEENGTILSIGEWVLRTAVKSAKRWMNGGMEPIIMAVNLSAIQFRTRNLPDLVANILKETGLPPEYLELELTEGVAMQDPQRAISMMNEIHSKGVRMSIDDFGTGYSSLSYLKKFNIYKLKIDQSFIRDINVDPEDKAIVAAIISMAKSLGLQTIAEGVETIGQLEYLYEQGCDEIQGYYFSKPLPIEEFELLRLKISNI
ncbi:MAG: EAL domain-containing protein [Thiovulaceae bacterium]|nr:EAL domain-containing protein [Sulfurimonadaceae bacterium]